MSEFIKIKLGIKHEYNPLTNRHFLNGVQTVYHCHHFTTLYTQLALDAGETNLLASVSEESFFKLLSDYYAENNISKINERILIATQYYSALGLGVIEVENLGAFSATINSSNSHIEEGWVSKWGTYDKPINYIGCGYVSAMMSAILDKPIGTYGTHEIDSIVMGSKKTIFMSFVK